MRDSCRKDFAVGSRYFFRNPSTRTEPWTLFTLDNEQKHTINRRKRSEQKTQKPRLTADTLKIVANILGLSISTKPSSAPVPARQRFPQSAVESEGVALRRKESMMPDQTRGADRLGNRKQSYARFNSVSAGMNDSMTRCEAAERRADVLSAETSTAVWLR